MWIHVQVHTWVAKSKNPTFGLLIEVLKKIWKNFSTPKKNNFFKAIIKNNSHIGLTQFFLNNAFLCDRKFRKLQKLADSILEMQIYTSTQKVKNRFCTQMLGFCSQRLMYVCMYVHIHVLRTTCSTSTSTSTSTM